MYVCVSGVRNVSFSENVAYVLNGWPHGVFLKSDSACLCFSNITIILNFKNLSQDKICSGDHALIAKSNMSIWTELTNEAK